MKTFITPIFLYRESICLSKEFVNEANKITFDFIWKGQDKVNRSALVSDIEDGALKAPHLVGDKFILSYDFVKMSKCCSSGCYCFMKNALNISQNILQAEKEHMPTFFKGNYMEQQSYSHWR